jgi:hypothetical protein
MEKIRSFGQRKKGMCRAEIEAIRTHEPVVIRVYFLDGQAEELGVDASGHIRDVIKAIGDKLSLASTAGWALFETTPEKETHVVETTCTGDLLFDWEVTGRSGQVGLKFNSVSADSPCATLLYEVKCITMLKVR